VTSQVKSGIELLHDFSYTWAQHRVKLMQCLEARYVGLHNDTRIHRPRE